MTNPADFPPPVPWEKRLRSATSIRGGYTGQLKTLRKICQFVEGDLPKRSVLVNWIKDNLEMERKNSEDIVRNLLTRRVLECTDSEITLNQLAGHWYASEDDGLLIALLHSRIQFFGEMLEELHKAPLTIEELLEAAGKYGLEWRTPSQIQQRRGWLESAHLIKPVDGGRLGITDTGRRLLSQLQIHQPSIELPPTQTRSSALAQNLGGIDYVSPTRYEPTESKGVFEVDPDLVDRGTTAHMDVQDELAEVVRSAGLKPLSPASHDPQFDVAWKMGNSAFVAEVKSLTEENEERQLRLGLGQVLSYAHLLGWPEVKTVQPVLAVERRPTEKYWEALCAEHGVLLTWPDEFKELFG